MDDYALELVVSSLENDAFRRSGSPAYHPLLALLALSAKHQLSAEAIVFAEAVRSSLSPSRKFGRVAPQGA